ARAHEISSAPSVARRSIGRGFTPGPPLSYSLSSSGLSSPRKRRRAQVKEKKVPQDPAALRQTLLELLEADPPHEEKLLARFERLKGEGPVYSSILYILTHLRFSEVVAKKHWQRIRAHRDALQMQLGRDIGLRVALLDYFVNL